MMINTSIESHFHTFKAQQKEINVIGEAKKFFNQEQKVYLYDNRYLVALTKEQYTYFSLPQQIGGIYQNGTLKNVVDLLNNSKRLNLSCTLIGLELEEIQNNIKKGLEF